MPIVIGAKPESTFADPMGLLTDCHRRIERFLEVLVRLAAEAQGSPLSSEQRQALETALRYFREAAPKHTADEEETLFPRLRRMERPELQAVLEKVEGLKNEHAQAERNHAEVERLGQAWLISGWLAPADSARFAELVGGLADLYRGHIAVEERELFPAAAAVLPGAERAAMGREMAARRGLRHE
ncbi:MAG TPA: hemerythrin domain-containing protein [Bryobacteraceae bacterium]|nr:hemerythrin domain-containing protein [Bryobacteraceae bacterium]